MKIEQKIEELFPANYGMEAETIDRRDAALLMARYILQHPSEFGLVKKPKIKDIINEVDSEIAKLVSLEMDYLDLQHHADQLAEALRDIVNSDQAINDIFLRENINPDDVKEATQRRYNAGQQAQTALTNYEQNNKTK